MSANPSFDNLLVALRARDGEAARQLFERFSHRLIGLARGRLDQLLRRKEDPEDVVQSVFKSFFRRVGGTGFDLHSWDSVWGILTVITVRKCNQHRKYHRAARRDVQREVGPTVDDEAEDPVAQALGREPTPAEAVMLTELLERVMSSLSPSERTILTLSLQGHDVPDVAIQVGLTQRSVQRVLQRVRQRLEKLDAAAASSPAT